MELFLSFYCSNSYFFSSKQNLAAPSPATNPVLQHPIKLNPPVTPSTSNTSPHMNKPGLTLLSMLDIVISFKCTPPAVTNSSLNTPLDVTVNGNEERLVARVRIMDLDASPHVVVDGISECWTSAAHSRFGTTGMLFVGESAPEDDSPSAALTFVSFPFVNNGQPVATFRFGIKRVISQSASISIPSPLVLPPPPPDLPLCSSSHAGQKWIFTSH
mmetsp:Transcript_43924/g.74988  ORF Transcript_43924/g.74988 Transcript_43924/m.74988 type:complete len:215 (+) Transcript_43924:7-651(+)